MDEAAPLRLVVDALAARFGGTVHVVAELAGRFAADPAVDAVLVLTRPRSLLTSVLVAAPGVEVHEVSGPARLELGHRLLWEAVRLPRLVRRWRGDALLTVSGMLPRDVGVPVVSYVCNPVLFERGGPANRLRRRAVASTARRAKAVLVPSAALAELAAPTLGARPAVVPHGVDRTRFRPAGRPGGDVLVVGDMYPHKRHDLALAAWAALPPPRPTLRFRGDSGVAPAHGRQVREAAASAGGYGEVVFHDRMPQEQLAELYRGARVLLAPSEHESFALPLLEAIASGVPVVARDLPAHRETADGGALYLAGDDASEWARALAEILGDDTLHGRLRAAGVEHAAAYDWDAAAATIRDRLLA